MIAEFLPRLFLFAFLERTVFAKNFLDNDFSENFSTCSIDFSIRKFYSLGPLNSSLLSVQVDICGWILC
jgi:hypothetical protein